MNGAGRRGKGDWGVGELSGLGAAEYRRGLAEAVGGVELGVVEGDVVDIDVDVGVNVDVHIGFKACRDGSRSGIHNASERGARIPCAVAVVDLHVTSCPFTATRSTAICTTSNVIASSGNAILQSPTILRSRSDCTTASNAATTATTTILEGHATRKSWADGRVGRRAGTLCMSRPTMGASYARSGPGSTRTIAVDSGVGVGVAVWTTTARATTLS
jgi:hypothetical protein